MTKDEIILANKDFLFPAVFHFYKEPLVVARAKDQYVWDADGNRFDAGDFHVCFAPIRGCTTRATRDLNTDAVRV